jgi:transcriptional regulator with XRE-family HTH domain
MGGRKMTPSIYRLKGECDKEPYHYTECGLDDVYLASGYELENTEYGEAVSVKNADGLHVAIGVYLAKEEKTLSGKELRFLRKEMGLTQAELGQYVGLDAQTVARWEKDQYPITAAADAVVRILYLEHVGKLPQNIRELLTKLEELDSQLEGKVLFEKTNGNWKPRLAA